MKEIAVLEHVLYLVVQFKRITWVYDIEILA